MKDKIMIKIEDLHKSFSDLEVLKGIDLDVHEGEVISIIGGSGSGKSTLLRCINFLEKKNKGHIYVNGKKINRSATEMNKLREKVGMVFQRFNLFPHKTVLKNVMVGPLVIQKKNKDEVKQKAYKLLDKVGLADKADVYPAMLSGGQQQRVAIARALINNPKVLLADEPTGNLDSKNAQEVINLFKKLRDECKRTIILVTHQESFAKISDRIVYIKDGVIE